MINRIYILFWLSVCIILTDFQNILSLDNVNAKLKSQYNLKVCDTDKNKEFLLTLGIGQINVQDSLYGFDAIIKYNPERVKILGPIYLNTVTEFLKYKDVNIGFEDNAVRVFAFSETPMIGNKELIGFYGKVLDDCIEPIEFIITDFEVADDYTKSLNVDSILVLTPNKIIDSEKIVEINFDKNELNFENNDIKNTTVFVEINPYKFMDNMYFDIELDENSPFIINEIISTDENITVNNFTHVANSKYELELNIFDTPVTNSYFNVNISRKENHNIDFSTVLKLKPRNFENCNCYSEFKGSELNLLSKKNNDSTVSVNDHFNKSIDISYSNGNIYVINENIDEIKRIEVYDLLGDIINVFNINQRESIISKSLNNINSGTYLIRVVTENLSMNKLIVIYN